MRSFICAFELMPNSLVEFILKMKFIKTETRFGQLTNFEIEVLETDIYSDIEEFLKCLGNVCIEFKLKQVMSLKAEYELFLAEKKSFSVVDETYKAIISHFKALVKSNDANYKMYVEQFAPVKQLAIENARHNRNLIIEHQEEVLNWFIQIEKNLTTLDVEKINKIKERQAVASKKWGSEKITCGCGGLYSKDNKSKHCITIRHTQWVNL